jgi:hypothetical protein
VPNQSDKQESVELEQLNVKLTQGLRCCRKLIFDYRSKLGSNSKRSKPADDDSDETSV